MEFKKRFGYRKPTNKSGCQYSITIPKEIIDKMKISEEERDVIMLYDEKKEIIIIKKS